MKRFIGIAILLLAAACATGPRSPEGFLFGVMGDAPYSKGEEKPFVEMIERMNGEPLAFVIHVGDIKAGSNSRCTEALFLQRKAWFDTSTHPLIYTPGDNEWTDCRRKSNGTDDPLERLVKLREVFFAGRSTLGTVELPTEAQADAGPGCNAYPENRIWSFGRVRFATVNVPGSKNNEGFDAASDAEALCRNAANRKWIDHAADLAERDNDRALVIATQADPWLNDIAAYRDLIAHVTAVSQRLRRPVMFVHGDTHTYHYDTPFKDASGTTVANALRLETYGSPLVGWVRVIVDPADPALFSVEPMLHAIVPPIGGGGVN
ncbi:MAG TPA: hypothetical protein VGI57_04585 [Usitatibacter sp.]